jgi:hypothetical protein
MSELCIFPNMAIRLQNEAGGVVDAELNDTFLLFSGTNIRRMQ